MKKASKTQEPNIPAILMEELKKNKAAFDHFESLPPSHKKEYIKWIEEAKKEETKKKRAEQAIEMLTRKEDPK